MKGNYFRESQFLSKRVCGLWLIWIALVIFGSAIRGGQQDMFAGIFYPGYIIGIVFILANKRLLQRLSFGQPSRFQKQMSLASIILMFILMVAISGHAYVEHDYRMIWLGAFLAIAIHFIPFSLVHGKSMIVLAVPLAANAMVGILDPNVPFGDIAYVDAALKLAFGVVLLWSKRPTQISVVTV